MQAFKQPGSVAVTGDAGLEKLRGQEGMGRYWPKVVLSRNYEQGLADIKIQVLSPHADSELLLTFESTAGGKEKMQRKNTNSVTNFVLPKASVVSIALSLQEKKQNKPNHQWTSEIKD